MEILHQVLQYRFVFYLTGFQSIKQCYSFLLSTVFKIEPFSVVKSEPLFSVF